MFRGEGVGIDASSAYSSYLRKCIRKHLVRHPMEKVQTDEMKKKNQRKCGSQRGAHVAGESVPQSLRTQRGGLWGGGVTGGRNKKPHIPITDKRKFCKRASTIPKRCKASTEKKKNITTEDHPGWKRKRQAAPYRVRRRS